MKRARWRVIVGVLLCGIAVAGAAQEASTVFDIEPGVRMLGAGSAGLSVASGAETLYHNPANLTKLPGISFASSYVSYLGIANYSAFSLTLRNLGVALLMLNSTGIDGYDGQGSPTGPLAYRNTGLMFGIGVDSSTVPFLRGLGFDLAVGVRAKYVSARIAEDRGSGFTMDLGLVASFPGLQVGPFSVTNTSFAVNLVNMLGGVSYDAHRDDLLTELQVGMSARIANAFLVAVDLHFGGSSHVGLAYAPVPSFELRAGLISKGGISFTFGAGVNVQGFLIDYAYASHRVGGTHRVSLTLDFTNLDVMALRSMFRRILP